MDRFDDNALAAELRALRPTPRPEFAAELDERAAAGFPRGTSSSTAATPFARLVDRWRGLTPRRRLVPALAVGLAALVVATGVVAITHADRSDRGADLAVTARSAESSEGGGGSQAEATGEVLHSEGSVELAEPPAEVGGACAKSAAGCGANGKFEGNFFGEGEESAPAGKVHRESGAVAPLAAEVPPVEAPESSAAAGQRDIERSAYVVLGTKPGGVSSAAAKVYEAVHAADGIVLHSSVQSGKAGATGASFDLLIPGRKLDDALTTFSSIAEVRERHDATNDITAPTVGAAEELADSNAAIESLLKELGDAETESERESVEARLREERGRHATIRSSLDQLHERASMSEVSVRIVTGHGAGVVPQGKGDGNWGVGDALGDAGGILTVAAGVVLIALAVLGPIALIAIILWGGNRLRVRRLRERTLG